MTFHYPDISGYQAGISLAGCVAVCIKATEGTSYSSKDFGPAQSRARQAGAWAFAYHFLHAGNAARQASWALAHTGKMPLMLDFEPSTSKPSVADATGFVDAYRKGGGICNLLYLPRWYWTQLGSPNLAPFANRGMKLVSSHYTSYSDHGPGWAAYGGMTVAVWQHTDKMPLAGQQVDGNAFKGSLAELQAAAGGKAGPHPDWFQGAIMALPTLGPGATDKPNQTRYVHRIQVLTAGIGRWNKLSTAAAVKDTGTYDAATANGVKEVQKYFFLTADGICGPNTWTKLMGA